MVEKLIETKIDNADPKRKGKNILLFILIFILLCIFAFFFIFMLLKKSPTRWLCCLLAYGPWKCQILGDFFTVCDGVITFSNVGIRNCLKLRMVMFFLFHLLTLVSLVNLLNLPSFWFQPRRMLPFLSVFFCLFLNFWIYPGK